MVSSEKNNTETPGAAEKPLGNEEEASKTGPVNSTEGQRLTEPVQVDSGDGANDPDASEDKKQEKKEIESFFKPSRGKKEQSDLVERVIKINRVSKVVKGGKNFSFSALVVTGNGKGSVGLGLGKSNEVVEAIKKGTVKANKNSIKVTLRDDTIPHEVIGKYKASRVIMKPAVPGTGVIAGGPVRAMCDAAGIKDILTKTLGSRNAVNVVKAAADGFKKLRLERRGLDRGGEDNKTRKDI